LPRPCIGVKDTACVDACPVDCIHPKKGTPYDDGRPSFDEVSQVYIDPIECIDFGACVPVCPVCAIFALEDLPAEEVEAIYGLPFVLDGQYRLLVNPKPDVSRGERPRLEAQTRSARRAPWQIRALLLAALN